MQPDTDVVHALEKILEAAKAGHVRSFAAVWETEKANTTNSVVVWGFGTIQMLVGELERLKFLMCAKLIGDDGDSIGLEAPEAETEPEPEVPTAPN